MGPLRLFPAHITVNKNDSFGYDADMQFIVHSQDAERKSGYRYTGKYRMPNISLSAALHYEDLDFVGLENDHSVSVHYRVITKICHIMAYWCSSKCHMLCSLSFKDSELTS